MSSPLHLQILNAINSVRPYLYGTGFKVRLLKFNGVDRQYDELSEIANDFIVSIDRTGNITLMVSSDAFVEDFRDTTHIVFQGYVYQFTEPAKPEIGPFPLWKATGRPLGSKYVAEP